MKHNFLIGALMLVFNFAVSNVYAQLEVESSGDVKISKNVGIGMIPTSNTSLNIYKTSQSTSVSYGIQSHVLTRTITPNGPIISIYGYADGLATTTSSSTINQIIGIYGKALSSSSAGNKFTAGVVGVATTNRGVGVYGAIASSSTYSLPTTWGAVSYAGYFEGAVRVTGTLTAASVTTTSDSRFKTDIQDIQPVITNKIFDLRPVSYKFNISDTTNNVYLDELKEMDRQHYGLIAQDVQKVAPELVYEDGAGYLSVNYIELIPLLIQVVNKQQQQISTLQQQIQELQTK